MIRSSAWLRREGYPPLRPWTTAEIWTAPRSEKGAVLYLPVFVEGALLSMGDFHGIMGDGEVEDCGLEIERKGHNPGGCGEE